MDTRHPKTPWAGHKGSWWGWSSAAGWMQCRGSSANPKQPWAALGQAFVPPRRNSLRLPWSLEASTLGANMVSHNSGREPSPCPWPVSLPLPRSHKCPPAPLTPTEELQHGPGPLPALLGFMQDGIAAVVSLQHMQLPLLFCCLFCC